MARPIDWEKECEEIAAELVADVHRRFVRDKEIDLHTSLHIGPGAVHGLIGRTPLHDEWGTVMIEYAVIPRREIVFDEGVLREAALRRIRAVCALECWRRYKKSPYFAIILREYAECAVGKELTAIFDRTAAAAPGKYPVRRTHGHAAPSIRKTRPRMVKGLRIVKTAKIETIS